MIFSTCHSFFILSTRIPELLNASDIILGEGLTVNSDFIKLSIRDGDKNNSKVEGMGSLLMAT